MKTATKNTFSREQLHALISRQFPAETITAVEELPGGTFNTVYRVEGTGVLSGGLILKTGPADGIVVPAHERNTLRTEVEAYRLLEGRELPVPKIYAADFSHDELPCDWFLMERMEGETWLDLWPKHRAELMGELGRYTARIHSVTGGWFGDLCGEKRYKTWGAAFSKMIEGALTEAEQQGLKLPFEKIRKAVALRMGMLDTVTVPVLVNFDMWAGNILLKKRKWESISGIIDFERSFFGDPLASFATALMLYDNVEKEPDLLAAYNETAGQAMVLGPAERERMLLYELLMYLRFYCETHRYGFWMRLGQRLGVREIISDILSALKRAERNA